MTTNPNRCWGTPFTDAEIESARAAGQLLTMELELSRICNLRCIYCYAGSGEKLANEISFEEITDALDQGKALGVRKVIVLGGGEPMAYPRIMDVLRAIHARGLEMELFTNGILLTREIVQEFLTLGVHPVIKCNSLKPEVQDHLAGKKGAFAAIRTGFDLLREAGYPTRDLSLGAQTIICEQNYDELPEMWRWLRSREIIPYFECITDQGRAKDQINLAVSPEKLQSLFSELSRLDAEEFGIHWEPKPPVAAFTCRRHLFSCTITAVGNVIPCPGVDISAGNIREKALKDILAGSEVFQNLRNIRETIKGECRDCSLSRECYGCRGMAYNATGDYLAADPLCWRNAANEEQP
ncbi:radical SAM/SPASM domain-containing protein [Salidesulfovibrio onnuriiensis]|uniref:radical SAM/SPASM domain-containing protein n=1 Tax=Salidesulfovibrio onnuriiensis TaxID=2583823 RepID=UPI0011CB7329|nr:radical SAM protein [Salidesulfovibrio onnuriiensis]